MLLQKYRFDLSSVYFSDDDDGDDNCLGSDNPEDFDVRVVVSKYSLI